MQAQAGGSGLSTEIESLRKELNIALAENAKLRGVHAAEAGLSVCLSVCLSVRLSICLSVCVSVYT
jgi:hypothetical protein